jgi:hypothetical protein
MKPYTKGKRAGLAVIGIVITAALLLVAAASAAPEGPSGLGEAQPGGFAPSADDGGAWEVGAEAAGGDLWAYACSEASYLTGRLTSRGWVSRFLYCGGNAWEEDFKRAGAGGNEHNYLDTVDLMFYVGHGSPSSFTFDSNHDDAWLTPNDCNYAWGNGDNEWVGLTSCQVLADSNRSQWAACMAGTHQILGFITNAAARMGTATQGYNWAYYITNNWTVTGAWFKACDVSQPAGRKVRVLAEELACYNDKPWSGIVCSDAWDYDYYYWDHTCGSELPRPMDASAIADMPVYRTPPLSLDEARAEYTALGTAFNMPARPPASAAGVATDTEIWSVQEGNRELDMERNSGLFTYYNMDMWSGQTAQAALAPRAASISAADARAIADAFLQQNNLMPGDAQFYEVTTDVLTQGSTAPQAGASGIVATGDTVYHVIYSRVLPAQVILRAGGPAVAQDFLVVGPGAKLQVYVPMTATLAAINSATDTPIVSGVQGGWRAVQQPTAGASAIDTVPIITEAQVRKAYEQVPTYVLLNTPPIDATSSTVQSVTLAYWEEGVSNIQSELIPVYALYVEYFQGAASLNKDYAYIPANATYMRPYAQILTGPNAPVKVGQAITLTAADATKTLAELGYDALLNFALGGGNPGDYLYEWFADSISDANKLAGGANPTASFTVRPAATQKDGMYSETIILRVTDISSSDLRSSIATYSLNVLPRLMLPIILKP